MTRDEIDEMLTTLDETLQYLQASQQRMREASAHIATVVVWLTRLEAVATTGGKATVATALPTRRPTTKKRARQRNG